MPQLGAFRFRDWLRMVAPQVVDELDVGSHGEVSHSDEDVLKVSLLGSNTSLDIYVCVLSKSKRTGTMEKSAPIN